MEPIVVTGATGRIGRTLVRVLSARGVPVRALSRSRAPGAALPGVSWMSADLLSPETLPPVLDGGHALFLLTPAGERMVEAQHHAIEEARRAGIPHVVKLSALGASDHSRSPVGRWHFEIEQELKASGLGWTILRPHYFMDNLLDQARTVRSEGRILSPVGPGRVPFIDSRDIAESAAVALTEPGHDAHKYTLTGGTALDYSEVAVQMSEVLGRPIAYVEESMEEASRRLRANHSPAWEIESALALWSYQRAGGPTAAISPDVPRLLGHEARSLREFLELHAPVFTPAASGGS
jgi:uncharacterized protein YbjT (DUF2867 family)